MRIERPTRGVSFRVLPGRPKSLDHDDLKVSGSDMISISVLKKKQDNGSNELDGCDIGERLVRKVFIELIHH